MHSLSVYSIFCITRAEVDLLFDRTLPPQVMELRWSAIKGLHSYLLPYIKEEWSQKLIDAVCEKKIGFIMQAKTLGEIREIMRPALPEKTYSGIVCRSPYHIPEEELMLWMHVSPYTRLVPEATERCMTLFKQVFGMNIDEYLRSEQHEG